MAKIRILMDTDVFIDALKGVRSARELFRIKDVEIYCSILSKKELLSKGGLKDSERKRIVTMLSDVRVLRIDEDISKKYLFLVKKYGERTDSIVDYIIAATAWSKKLPLLTRNKKHFKQIEEITLAPEYDVN
ncbi:MAG: PIN domain-containing protein [Thermodesulfovibrionales bacterium]|nr:PIN domain-containing protein [Thermodesulfovibrionales bacterium]